MATDEFEGMSLEALNAMLASANPAELAGASHALGAAAPDIANIARDLRWYIEQVKWHGAGGDAFREWGRGMVSETLVLSEYAAVVGQEMGRAGQALHEAKAAVPATDAMCYADPEKEKARLAAVAPKTNEAINQLNRLSSFYNASRDRIAAQPEPRFAALPDTGTRVTDTEQRYGAAGSGTSAANSSSGGHAGATTTGGHGYATTGAATPSSHTSVARTAVAAPHESAGTAIDSVKMAPPPETTTRPTLPTGPTPVQGQTPVLTPPPVLPGPLGKSGLERPSTMTRVGVPGEGPSSGRSTGGLRGPGIARPSGLPGTARGVTPEGITGGRPMPTTGRGTSPRLPMGTVVGEERAGTGMGRPPMGGMGHGPGGAPRGATGMGGRRLASEPGGTVGAPRASSAGRGEFTPGGTGLVNGNKRGTDRRRSTSSSAPDYLVEDEETWAMDHRKVVPPVVD
ncbi:WXG100 family type VII secretion target [Streptomyces sp. NPDC048696]|uniref:WXG100 family type VII secretion target n=1 Tax=Streptomyces sp. NPDC048696 TaxID=3365585 RepID=UPI0037171030